jgi:hypothetical protein
VLILVCLRLGWWQWDRARAVGGTAQNLGYALQWPAFGGFVVYAWFRMLRLELHPPASDDSSPDAGPANGADAGLARGAPGGTAAGAGVVESAGKGADGGSAVGSAGLEAASVSGRPRTVKVRRRYVPPAASPAAAKPSPEEPSDEALAAYNAYLSSLAGPDEQRTKL